MTLNVVTSTEMKVIRRIRTVSIPLGDFRDWLFDYLDENIAPLDHGPRSLHDMRVRVRVGAVQNLLELRAEWPHDTEVGSAVERTDKP